MNFTQPNAQLNTDMNIDLILPSSLIKKNEAYLPLHSEKLFTQTIELKSGATLLSYGSKLNQIFKIKSGALKVFISSSIQQGRHKNTLIMDQLLGANDLLGIEGLFDQQNEFIEIVAAADSIIEVASYEHALNLMNKQIDVYQLFTLQLIKNLNEQKLAKKYHYLASIRQKIANTLLQLASKFGSLNIVTNEYQLNLKISRSEIAQLAGTINESLSRHLSDFEKEDMIRLEGRMIFIKSIEKLKLVSST